MTSGSTSQSISSSRSSSSTSTSAASTLSPTPSSRPAESDKSNGSSSGFKLVYLTPILVFVVLLLLCSILGRIWGRYHHASRLEASRRAKYDKRASRQAKKREMQRIKTMWGFDRTPVLPPEMEAGEHDLHYKDPNAAKRTDADSSFGSSSDAGDQQAEKYPGTLKILSLALLGEGSRPEPPTTRGEGGRKYEAGVQSNSWLAVKVRRWVGGDEKALAEESRYTVAPQKSGSRRLRHALSRDRLRAADAEYEEKDRLSNSSPTTTLSVGSGEMKYKEHFSTVDLAQPTAYPSSPARYTSLARTADELNDPFVDDKTALGWRKPLPPQPKDSPFRPAILGFGLRSRSKTYDPVPHPAGELDTPVKQTRPQVQTEEGFLPKILGLGISGVWSTLTGNFAAQTEEDEESFVAHAYRPHSEVMSESDTPYSHLQHAGASQTYYDSGTPTKQPQLGRVGTVLQVKSTNQPWNTHQKTMSASAWHEALLASPVNKQQQVYQPLTQPSPTKTRDPAPVAAERSLAARKSLLLHQAITGSSNGGGAHDIASPAMTDYSDLVACYSTPSDVIKSPEAPSIRALSGGVSGERAEVGAREKLQRAKTAKFPTSGAAEKGVVRSKTSSTSVTTSTAAPTASSAESMKLGAGLSRKGTVHHSIHSKQRSVAERESEEANPVAKSVHPGMQNTQPLRVSKQPHPISIPNRGSSSPSKPASPFRQQPNALPTSLRIASPEPLPAHAQSYRQSLDITHAGFSSFHPHYPHNTEAFDTASSPPKRSKAVSNRSTDSDHDVPANTARGAAQKAKNRSNALAEVDQIVFHSYNNSSSSNHPNAHSYS